MWQRPHWELVKGPKLYTSILESKLHICNVLVQGFSKMMHQTMRADK